MHLEGYTAEEWQTFAENAHLICFNEHRPAEMNRIDFALLVVDGKTPQAYGTFREIDSETVYMQYGGSFPETLNTVKSFQAYCLVLNYLKERYKRATTLIENTNLVMMKFAMKQGLRIIGVRNFKGSILLEHYIEWRE
jgi:hypothetical protein